MKKNIIYSAVLALAVVIASTGCKHRPPPVTQLSKPSDVAQLNTPPPTFPTETVTTETNAFAEESPFDPKDWNMDRSALAADTIHFAFDSAIIRDSDKANLQAVAQALQSDTNANLLIEGNCDERGTEEYNRALGEHRADAAREALAGMSIDPSRTHTISYGKDKPVDPGHDEAAWSQNRRDDFVILHHK